MITDYNHCASKVNRTIQFERLIENANTSTNEKRFHFECLNAHCFTMAGNRICFETL